MRIERINENKLRVFVTLEDLADRDIDLNAFNYDAPETQELFWELMEQAEVELGFDSTATNLSVEAMTDMEHGFVITITRIDEEGEFESIQKFIKNRYKKKDLTVRQKATAIISTVSIIQFDLFDDMAEACKNILPYKTGSSIVWKCDQLYYLVLYGMDAELKSKNRFDDILSEYGQIIQNTQYFEGYLNEYGQKFITADAIAQLAVFSK